MTQSDSIDEGVCGHETADGTPCQNPASHGDSCYIPSHGGDGDPGGRPSKYTDDRAADAIQAASEGFSKAGCARAAGVGEATLQRWLDDNPDYNGKTFRGAFTRARHDGERTLVQGPLTERPDDDERETVDGQHARFLLSTSFGYTKTEKHELENTGDDPLAEVTIDFDDVDT